jgi:hypothetical protein
MTRTTMQDRILDATGNAARPAAQVHAARLARDLHPDEPKEARPS